MTKTQTFDPAEYLTSPEVIAAFVTEALESGDNELIATAIGTVARAQGITKSPKPLVHDREPIPDAQWPSRAQHCNARLRCCWCSLRSQAQDRE